MKGRITKFYEDKGFGFITDSNGMNRFFHISDVKSSERLMINSEVEFTQSENDKGITAKDIFVVFNKVPVFISFGDVRIKLTNIKNYGMDTVTSVEERLKEKWQNQNALIVHFEKVGRYNLFKDISSMYDKIKITNYVLYVTTYQGDNYRFSENKNFDIHKKFEELDSYLIN